MVCCKRSSRETGKKSIRNAQPLCNNILTSKIVYSVSEGGIGGASRNSARNSFLIIYKFGLNILSPIKLSSLSRIYRVGGRTY